MGTKKPPGSQCDVKGGIETDPKVPNHQEYAKPVQVLCCRQWGTHSVLKEFLSSKRDI